MGNTAGIGEQEESQGCWGRAGLQLGDAADPGGQNSELTSSGFALRSSRARIRAELGGWAWILSEECPPGAGIGMVTEQLQGAASLLRAAGNEDKQEQVQMHSIIY